MNFIGTSSSVSNNVNLTPVIEMLESVQTELNTLKGNITNGNINIDLSNLETSINSIKSKTEETNEYCYDLFYGQENVTKALNDIKGYTDTIETGIEIIKGYTDTLEKKLEEIKLKDVSVIKSISVRNCTLQANTNTTLSTSVNGEFNVDKTIILYSQVGTSDEGIKQVDFFPYLKNAPKIPERVNGQIISVQGISFCYNNPHNVNVSMEYTIIEFY